MATTITAGNATNGLAFSADNTGILELKTGTGSGTTAVTISTAQVVSIPGNLSFNSGYGSSAVAYGCRAWVNFNGTGTVAIRASGNVSSITDNGTGNYTVNFTTAMPDVNYAISISAQEITAGGRDGFLQIRGGGTYSTSAVQIFSGVINAFNAVDNAIVNVAIFR